MKKTMKNAEREPGDRADFDRMKPLLREMGISISFDQWIKAGNSRPELLAAIGDINLTERVINERVIALAEAIVLLSSPEPALRGPWTESIVQYLYECVALAGKRVDQVTERAARGLGP